VSIPSFGATALRAAAALGAVLLLIAALAYLFRRLRDVSPTGATAHRIRSTGRLDLGGRREIRLVEVAGRRLLVGVTGDRIDLLTELEPADGERGEPEATSAERSGPLAVLRKLATS
jgi:flagellar biosynthetic protein FliO